MKFIPQGNNSVLAGDDFYVSYNPATEDDSYLEGKLANLIGSWAGLPNKGPETALVIDGKFYILVGDWRMEYEDIAQLGKQACLDFYISQKARHNSPWSDGLPKPRLSA